MKLNEVNETRFLVPQESRECKCELKKLYAIQKKKGIIMNATVSVEN